jgi:recombination protein RecR
MNPTLEYLIDALKSLPGVGTKQAKTIAQFLLNKDEIYINEFVNRIKDAKKNIHFCKFCNNLTSSDICEICSNHSRDQNKLCIVTSQDDLQKLESTNSFIGLYFVLNQEIDVKTKQNIPHEVIEKLIDFVNNKKFTEIIIATN